MTFTIERVWMEEGPFALAREEVVLMRWLHEGWHVMATCPPGIGWKTMCKVARVARTELIKALVHRDETMH